MEESDLLGIHGNNTINNNDTATTTTTVVADKQKEQRLATDEEEKKEIDLLSPSFNNDEGNNDNNNKDDDNNDKSCNDDLAAALSSAFTPKVSVATTAMSPSTADVEAIFEGGSVTTRAATNTPTNAQRRQHGDRATIVDLPPPPTPPATSTMTPKNAGVAARASSSAGANTKHRSSTPSSFSYGNTPSLLSSPHAAATVDYSSTLSPTARLRDTFASFIPASLTAKHTLPDKTVASQVLMYRQLLHTECRPGLKLSREFQGTPAQVSVMYMPWWEKNVFQTKRMSISYDNLITRLWVYGAILPFVVDDNSEEEYQPEDEGQKKDQQEQEQQEQQPKIETTSPSATNAISSSSSFGTISTAGTKRQAALEAAEEGSAQNNSTSVDQACEKRGIDTMMNEKGLPPIPHEYWVSRAGFQQDDPVTDFRSGGVLSLAMLLHVVESCPIVHSRFIRPNGDASVLPFGITSINVTDMLAKICMFSKAVDKMDALLTAKPFWKMFNDPNSLLALQEISMDILADVVVELSKLKKLHILADENDKANVPSKMKDPPRGVTVFDFPEILEKTEKRVRDDLLNSGPRTVEELRNIAFKLRVKYVKACEKKERVLMKKVQEKEAVLQRQQQQKQQKEDKTTSHFFGTAMGNNGSTSNGIHTPKTPAATTSTATTGTPMNNPMAVVSDAAEGLFNNIALWGTPNNNGKQKQRVSFEFARPVQNDDPPQPPPPGDGNLISLL